MLFSKQGPYCFYSEVSLLGELETTPSCLLKPQGQTDMGNASPEQYSYGHQLHDAV